MPDIVTVQGTAVAVHRKASSDCCGAKLRLAAEDAEHEHECTACDQPATRVLADPVRVPVSFGAEFPAPAGQSGGAQ